VQPRSYYDKSGAQWTLKEEADLINEYVQGGLSIMKIGEIHKRTPGGISWQLKRLNIIDNNLEARGYQEYRLSSLYKEITESGKKNQPVKKDNDSKNSLINENFTRAGEAWLGEESEQLIDEYQKQELNLIEIANIHKRKPSGIMAQIVRLNLAASRSSVRGYLDYLKSDLYKSLYKKREEKVDSEKKDLNVTSSLNGFEMVPKNELYLLREEIYSLKNKMSHLISLWEKSNSTQKTIFTPNTVVKKNLVNTNINKNV
jgi:hypothetical protein